MDVLHSERSGVTATEEEGEGEERKGKRMGLEWNGVK